MAIQGSGQGVNSAPHIWLESSGVKSNLSGLEKKNHIVPTNGTNPSGDRLKINNISPYSATNSRFFACWAEGFNSTLSRVQARPDSSAHFFIRMPVYKTNVFAIHQPSTISGRCDKQMHLHYFPKYWQSIYLWLWITQCVGAFLFIPISASSGWSFAFSPSIFSLN